MVTTRHRQTLIERTGVRYAFAVLALVVALALRTVLEPATGPGAPYLIFLGAVLVTSVAAGIGPGLLATVLAAPLAGYLYVAQAGYRPANALVQSLVFVLEGVLVVYVAELVTRARWKAAEAEDRLRLACDAAAISLWDLDVTRRRLRWAAGTGLALGVPDELDFATWQGFVHPDDRHSLEQDYVRSLDPAGTGEIRSEFRIRRPDGGERWISWTGRTSFEDTPAGRQAVRQVGAAIDVTERKRAEESRALLAGIVESTDDAIASFDLEDRVLSWNPGAERMYGIPAAEAIGRSGEICVPPEKREERRRIVARVLRGERIEPFETVQWRADHSRIPVVVTLSAIRNSQGRPVARCAVVHDISVRKEADALRESEQRFRALFEHASDGIFLVDAEGRFTEANSSACRLLGYSAEELAGMTVLDFIVPEERAVVREGLRALSHGGDRAATRHIRRRDGRRVPVEISAKRLPDGLIQAFVRDITERERREQEQRFLAEAGAVLSSSLDYEQTLASVGQLVVREFADVCIVEVADPGGDLRRVDVACAEPCPSGLCEALRRMFLDRAGPRFARWVAEHRQPFLIERATAADIDANTRPGAHRRLLEGLHPRSLLALPMLVRGQLLGVLIFISTKESRTFSRADLPFAEALANRAALAIENGRLYREAVRATQLRNEVLGIVAHDLRNPLATIMLHSDVLQRRLPAGDAKGAKAAESIRRCAARMSRLIQDLLDVSSIDAGKLGVAKARFPAAEFLVESVDAHQALVHDAKLALRLDLPRGLPDVWGDRERLAQVLDNLIGNAIKFTPAGGRIAVGARSLAGEVEFRVTDTGRGISAEMLPHVFDRFWQARPGEARGSGLGLAVARGIVEAHGGRIGVESTEGRGSTFFFTVPQAPSAAAPGPEARHLH